MMRDQRWTVKIIAVIASALLSIALAACAGSVQAPAEETSGAEAGAGTSNLAADQVLHVAWEGSMGNGPIPGLDIGSAAFPYQAFRTCLRYDAQGETLPDGLCDSYEANADNTVFTFHINPDAVWSDGKKITAQDFVDWWTFIFHPTRVAWTATFVFSPVLGLEAYTTGEADTIDGIKAIDDETLEITLTRPEGWFPLRMAWRWSAPARVDQYAHLLERESEFATSQDWWAAMSEVWMGDNASNLIVSGPFKYVHLEPEPAAIFQLEQNPNWWGEKPTLTRIEANTVRDFQTMLLMFENGDIDVALSLSGPPSVLLRQSQPEAYHEAPSFGYTSMWLDTAQEPMNDINLRKALLHSIDWQQVADVAWEGEFPAMNGGNILTPNMPCYDPNFQPYPFDPEQAKQFLAESEYGPTGATVPKIRILTAGSDPSRIRATQIIQEMWRVNLDIEDVEIKNVETEFVDGAGLVAIRVSSGGAPIAVPALTLEEAIHSRGYAAQEATHYSTPELDAEIDQLLSMDVNSPEYCPALQTALEKVSDAAIVIPTAWWKSFYQLQPWVKGFEINMFPEWIAGWNTETSTVLTER